MSIVFGQASAEAACENSGLPGTPYQGFGAVTSGGAGRPVYRVTTRADSGPGSLREAVSQGNRCVVFDVAGDIVLQRQIYVEGASVTIDGFSAPSPGVTLRDYGISLWGSLGARDIIIRGLRFRNAGQKGCSSECWDGLQLKNGVSRVVIDHVSSDRSSDGAIDINGGTNRDITIQWSILSGTRNQALIAGAYRVSMHHNLFINGQNRNPQADWDSSLRSSPPDTVLDFRNNLVWDYTAYGTLVQRRATANVVNNYYHSPSRPTAEVALSVATQARVYAAGNHASNGADVDGSGTENRAFSAPLPSTTDACRAAYEVQDEAGARGDDFGPDSVDRGHLNELPSAQLPGCAPGGSGGGGSSAGGGGGSTPPPPSSSPQPPTSGSGSKPDLVFTSLAMTTTLQRGRDFSIQFGVQNRGSATATGSRVKIYLSTDGSVSSNDVLLRDRAVAALGPGASQTHSLSEIIPTTVRPGTYFVLLVTDANRTVTESSEGNNVKATAVTVR
jgi:pectate lyase